MKTLPSLSQPVSVYGSRLESETAAVLAGIAIGIAIGIYLK
ncbi:hypothetical protein [Thalassotalea marina]|nr:hypothetical protein [Thalassotalea marina]